MEGGGYPDPPGASKPVPGTCGVQQLNSNHSESWLAVQPGTENLVGTSKFFFDRYCTFYNFYLGSYTIQNGAPAATNQVQGYECTTVGTQAMPPSWTNNTDPNVDFDTQGPRLPDDAAVQRVLGGDLHPNSAIDALLQRRPGPALGHGQRRPRPGAVAERIEHVTFGHVEDKQWVAVNDIAGQVNADHVYAMWTVFNGSGREDHGRGLARPRRRPSRRPSTLSHPSATTPGEHVRLPVRRRGRRPSTWLSSAATTRRTRTASAPSTSPGPATTAGPGRRSCKPATPVENPNGAFAEHDASATGSSRASPRARRIPATSYLTYENWDRRRHDGRLLHPVRSTAEPHGRRPTLVNDDAGTGATDQFQPSVAAGPGGAVAVAFYDRRAACPNDSERSCPPHRARTNYLHRRVGAGVPRQRAGRGTGRGRTCAPPPTPGIPTRTRPARRRPRPVAVRRPRRPVPERRGFIGDYFGLAVSDGNVYTLASRRTIRPA